ncbi:MAG: GNAT family N-acetyltransferase [Alphaproteobacteria bacterium]|nr:GNAT family N-acetyltransferase [Alphaproteobacteria bacterium]
MSRVVVRAMRRKDVPAVVAMMKGLIEEIRHHGEEAPGGVSNATVLKNGFGRDRWFGVLLATVDGRPAGYALHHRGYEVDNASRVLYLSDLYVREEARRLGVGRALMAGMAAECRRSGAVEVLWRVHAKNRAARSFYLGLGATDWRLGTTMWVAEKVLAKRATSRTRA